MSKKTIIIFIIVFIIVGGFVAWLSISSKKTNTQTEEIPWYQSFNPFGTGITQIGKNPNNNQDNNTEEEQDNDEKSAVSRFYRITDFAVAGATFLNDYRPTTNTDTEKTQIEPITVQINPNTKTGRVEIQNFLNNTLSLNPPLVADGNFGKLTTKAISDFQQANNLTATGKIDKETAPYLTKTIEPINTPQNQTEQAPSLRYVERANGHMYKIFLDTKSTEKISNSTIPGIYEALFSGTAQTIIYRYLSQDKTISSFIATLGAEKGDFLPQDISEISVSPDKTKFFYLTKNSTGVVGTVGVFGLNKKEVVFNSSFTEWLSQWANNQKIFLTTKSSYNVPGNIFILNTTSRTILKVFGGVEGLTTLVDPLGTKILYSYSSQTGPKLAVFDIEKHTAKDLNFYGLPEKCVWAKNGSNVYCAIPNTIKGNQYPDSWYQGLVSFDDFFVKINIETESSETIANSNNETPIDGTSLFLNTKEDALFFINKKDSTLWSLSLN